MGVADSIAKFTEPVTKLIEAIRGAIGKAYEPRYIKRIADAKAYEIRTISDELRNDADLPIVLDQSGNISIDISDYEALAKRAGRRVAYQEVLKQENIEAIVEGAYESLKDEKECADGEITREWMHRFIDAAGDISTEELQKLWSKVLAGEVLDPKSFSLRTLECLRNIDVEDARLFESVCKNVIANRFILNDENFLEERGISYDMILKLDECGLVNSSGNISLKSNVGQKEGIVLNFGKYILVGNTDGVDVEFNISQFPLTAAGRELSAIVANEIDLEYIKEICRIVAKGNEKIHLNLYRVTGSEAGGIIHYSDIPIRYEIEKKEEFNDSVQDNT